jgi:hypothetical protein
MLKACGSRNVELTAYYLPEARSCIGPEVFLGFGLIRQDLDNVYHWLLSSWPNHHPWVQSGGKTHAHITQGRCY